MGWKRDEFYWGLFFRNSERLFFLGKILELFEDKYFFRYNSRFSLVFFGGKVYNLSE